MPKVSVVVEIDNQAAPDLFGSFLEIEVEQDHAAADAFRIRLAIVRGTGGEWDFLDDDRLQLWKEISIAAEVDDERHELFHGYITQLRTRFDPEESRSYLEVSGMDPTCLMNLEEKVQDWPNKSDSDIAREVFQSYQLNADVEDTGITHDEAVTTIIQRETDIQFLKRLARRNGYECCVKGGDGVFRKPDLSADPLPVLSAHFGGDTTLTAFEASANALRPAAVEMHQIDTIGKQVDDADASAPDQAQLGRDGAQSAAASPGAAGRILVGNGVASGLPEMQNLCRAVYDAAEWLVEARGEVDGFMYGGVLEARRLVPVRGVGEAFSGIYYLTSVRHLFYPERYVQHFTARRNALAPSGEGDFGGGGLL